MIALPTTTAPVQAPAPVPQSIRALYAWGYAGPDGEGQGELAISLDPGTGRLVMEIHGAGERLALLSGDRSVGYRLQIPRQKVDRTVSDLATLRLPLLPELGGLEGLQRLLTRGEGPGVKVTKRDANGPVKLKYTGQDEKGREVLVWLKRERWETGA
nr:hypothetical protein [uncultured Holophaga sp.]